MDYKKITFNCEVITPMFMYGADRQTPELRPSEFKGMMRFWWRAIKAEDDIKKLWEEEAKIFGAADERFGKSKVKVILNWDKKKFEEKIEQDSKNWLKKNLKNYPGVKYLLYSIGLNSQEFLLPGFEFEVILSSPDEEILKIAVASFWCLVFLGGVGTRARRGGGNLRVRQVKEGKEILNGIEFEIKGEIEEWFKRNLEKIKQIISSQNKETNYTSLPKGKIFIFDPFNSWEEALNKIGEHFRNFRKRKNPDYSFVKEYLISGRIPSYIEKVEFGLPLSYRFKSLNKSAIIEGADKERQRSASPLIFKVIEQDQKFYPLIVVLNKSYLLDKKDKLKIRDTSKEKRQKAQNFFYRPTRIINDFLSTLQKCRRISL